MQWEFVRFRVGVGSGGGGGGGGGEGWGYRCGKQRPSKYQECEDEMT